MLNLFGFKVKGLRFLSFVIQLLYISITDVFRVLRERNNSHTFALGNRITTQLRLKNTHSVTQTKSAVWVIFNLLIFSFF